MHLIWFHSFVDEDALRAARSAVGPHRCQVSSGVFGQVVAAHEAAEAHWAGKLFLPRVGSAVAGQLIGASEAPLAALPLAFVWFLTCCGVKVNIV